jgi:hypothetical protein
MNCAKSWIKLLMVQVDPVFQALFRASNKGASLNLQALEVVYAQRLAIQLVPKGFTYV